LVQNSVTYFMDGPLRDVIIVALLLSTSCLLALPRPEYEQRWIG